MADRYPRCGLTSGAMLLALLLAWPTTSLCADPSDPIKPTWPPAGRRVRVEITRDTWLSTIGDEKFGSGGADTRFKIKGQQEYGLFDIDPEALKGKIVTGALWRFRCASPAKAPIVRTTVSTVAVPWVEGKGKSYQRVEGASCFVQAELGKRDWTYGGRAGHLVGVSGAAARRLQTASTFMDAAFGRGHTIWRFADPTPPDANGWQSLAVSPDVVAARAAGLSHGFGVYDDVGNVWTKRGDKVTYQHFPNRFINTIDSGRNKPHLEVWINGADNTPPPAATGLEASTADLPAGEALVTWVTPADTGGGKTLGFNVAYSVDGKTAPMPRYLIPMAGKPGQRVRMHIQDLPLAPGAAVELTVRAVDSAGNVGPAATKTVKVSANPRTFGIYPTALKPFPPSDKLPTVGGLKVAVVDLVDKIDPRGGRMHPKHPEGYLGGNHIWSAAGKLIRLQSGRNEAVCFQLNLAGRADRVAVAMKFDSPGLKTRIYRLDCVGTKVGAMPDVCVPVEGEFAVPFADDPQAAGAKNISLVCEVYVPHKTPAGLKSGKLTITVGGRSLELAIDLTVWDFTLPNKLSFVPEMNAYSTVDPRRLDYYRLAHEHRLCMNRLYYGWTGSPSMAPKTAPDGSLDFSQWDKWFGPLFDGSAFADLPRASEPVDVFYLHFNENWPVSVYANYRKSYWADEAFTDRYRRGLKKAFASMADHCNKSRWHDTIFQYYLNNKVYYKADRGWRGSSAPWIFDEPVNTQDFWAMRWYGLLWHQAVAPVKGEAKMWFRGDVSYSHFGRNIFWGIMDLECLGGANDQKVRMKRDENVLWGKSYFTEYGSANDPAEANIQPVVWTLKAWARGAVGILPWQTIGKESNMATGSKVGLFIPHGGKIMPSVRLKAFRRGQQDVEYLTLLGDVYGKPLYAVAGGMEQMVDLTAKVHKTSETDAGTIVFAKADPVSLWRLRTSVAQMVSARKPAYKRCLRPMPSPKRDLGHLPDIGYVRVAPKVPAVGPDMD